MTTRTAVIGAGSMGKAHLRSLASVPAAEVVALVDPDEETLESSAAENGAPSTYTDVAAMLAAEQPEYAIVASPVLYHAEQSIAAFEAGAHVLCEKPLCMDTTEAEAIVDAARRGGTAVHHGRFQLRQNRSYRTLKGFHRRGEAGGGLPHVCGGHTSWAIPGDAITTERNTPSAASWPPPWSTSSTRPCGFWALPNR